MAKRKGSEFSKARREVAKAWAAQYSLASPATTSGHSERLWRAMHEFQRLGATDAEISAAMDEGLTLSMKRNPRALPAKRRRGLSNPKYRRIKRTARQKKEHRRRVRYTQRQIERGNIALRKPATQRTRLMLPRAPRENPNGGAPLPPYLIETRDRGGKLHPSAAAWTPGEAIKVGRALLRAGHGVRVTGPKK